jgi:hypothetical protein
MPDDVKRSPAIPAPSGPGLMYRGQKITPGLILRLWRSGMSTKRRSRERILTCRAMRRKDPESLVALSPRWRYNNPEAASWVRDIRHERITLERAQIARVGAIEPEFNCEPLGFLKTDEDHAEEKEAYFEEWRVSDHGPPVQAFYGKAVEDGEYGRVRIPAHLDMDGCPDFFEMLDERAYEALPADERKAYTRDDADRRGRYVKLDKDGNKKRNPRFDKGSDDASKEAHDAAVQRYLLGKAASNGRIIPALDCAPIFVRGRGRDRWELAALVERTLYHVEELLYEGKPGEGYGWRGMGDRKLVPMAYNADGSGMRVSRDEIGTGDQIYVYTAYFLATDEDGIQRPVIASTVGATATWDAQSGDPDDSESVVLIDLYDQFKTEDGSCPALAGRALWSYHFGLHTEDDDPDHYGQPHLWAVLDIIRTLEGNKTAINAATTTNAFTGHYQIPDARLAEVAPEAVLEADGDTLRRPKIPGVGEIETAIGQIIPAQQATVSPDAWQQLANDQLVLQQATATDQPSSGASGHAIVVGETLAKVGQRHQRQGVLEAVQRDGEDHLRILHAIFECYGVKWPIQTVEELPVGEMGPAKAGKKIIEYDPDWIGSDNFELKAEYPEEENLARVDLEMNAAERGFSSFENVQKVKGAKDSQSEFVKVLKDRIRNHPMYTEMAMLALAEARGDKQAVGVLKALRQQQRMTESMPGVPGAANGLPSAALNRGQAPTGGSGGPTAAQSSRGGIVAAELGTGAKMADAEAKMAVGQGAM